jgi:hypothetical protein
VFDGTSGPPDGDGVFLGDGPALGVFPRKYVTHYAFVDLAEGRRRLGVALSDPPVTGGFVIDKFEYPPDASHTELLAETERRNGPLRIQYPNDELGESFPATAAGVDEAHMMCSALAQRGREIRLVSSRGVLLKHWNASAKERVNEPSKEGTGFKYVHVDHGTPHGTVWRLSDDADGAVMRIRAPAGTMTPKVAEQAFANAVFPMIIETSDDEGKTWVLHAHESPKRDWRGARGLLYALLASGRWNAGRIRASTGEELVRHPPKLLKDIADAVRATQPGARITLRPPMDQLLVELPNRRVFAAAPSMRTPLRWPVYVTPVPPPRPEDGSWECKMVEDVLATLRWPEMQPTVRIASLAEIRAK